MKLATTTGDFFPYGLNDKESIAAVAQSGFKCIDYSFGYDFNHRCGLLGDNWRGFADELLELSENLGVKFVQSHAPLGSPLVPDEKQESFIADTKRSIEAAAYLGIPNIVVHSGYVKGMSAEETIERNAAFYFDILKTAEKSGITVLTENFNKMCLEDYYWIDSAEGLRELVDRVNHPLLKICWDVGHANLQEFSQEEELKMLGDRVAAVHIQDNFGYGDDHTIPFFGTLNIDSVMHGLIDIGYNGYFTFEATNAPVAASRRRRYEKDSRCSELPIEFHMKTEAMLYDIGKYILTQYDCFEY